MNSRTKNDAVVVCPRCDGDGDLLGLFPVHSTDSRGPSTVILPCHQCGGSGKIPQQMLEWIERGEKLRDYRQSVLQIGLREAADKFGMKASELSEIECGRVDNTQFVLAGMSCYRF